MNRDPNNPYASPKAPPTKRPKPEKDKRLGNSLLYSFQSWLGVSMTLLLLWHGFGGPTIAKGSTPILFGFLCLASAPIGVAMSVWVWRKPKSHWPNYTANVLGACPFVLAALGVLLGVWG